MASHKSTQYWLVALKVFLLVLALGYIFLKIRDENTAVLKKLTDSFQIANIQSWLLFIGLATLNWLLEIYKWKISVTTWFPLKCKEAFKQTLGSLTASLLTPNRIGEYGVKALYFKPKYRKKIVFLNFVHSSSQMFVTLLFGVPALFYFIWNNNIAFATNKVLLLICVVSILLLLGYLYRKKQLGIKGLSIENFWKKFKEISKGRKLKIILLSVARYLVFSFLWYQLLQFFGGSILLKDAAIVIFTMYLLASIIPSFFVLDVVIRGGVAVWLFSFVGISEILILSTVFFMWLLNTVLPAAVGSYFVITFKPKRE
ncbi:hypothetical protein [Rasiella sp. SM2506]|uniref:hypothetical protein n=1 Tax=Rasiella sp. SM2506 TaxID=3423914 RepID=UPI003D7ADC74